MYGGDYIGIYNNYNKSQTKEDDFWLIENVKDFALILYTYLALYFVGLRRIN